MKTDLCLPNQQESIVLFRDPLSSGRMKNALLVSSIKGGASSVYFADSPYDDTFTEQFSNLSGSQKVDDLKFF